MRRARDGTNVGLAVAIAIGCANLALVGCVIFGLVRCVRRRVCYRCMQEVAPATLACINACGCGPDEEKQESWGDLRTANDGQQPDMEMMPTSSNNV